ncbi:hypothetical protein J7E50_09800 [Pedobacter sp. ISL-68]|uniref:hypothetical protein n=1 Tax=unclassified Pedobacter TaxID=2628915 RepID=UPI001BE91165|nr:MULTISPECIES: hypothetical protein [unclassified Pedobacter]MBT2561123.1 hypothetical protein [Pedobacter sp. ISL-64]MBT2590512.1 hypothetical protein [Pedobacter sp. ISL-68]
MLTFKEHIELREKLDNGEISIEIAKELYWKDFKEGKQSWHTKDWKERRATVIKDKCEICDSKETLTLQHLSHPRRFPEYKLEVTRAYARENIDTNSNINKSDFVKHINKNYDYLPVPLCPKCKFSNPNKRVTKRPQYLCTVCKHEFDEAVYKSVEELVSIFYEDEQAIEVRDKCFMSRAWENKHNLSSVRYWLQREGVKSNNAEAIEKEAFLLYLNDNIKYLSFEDTITACKRCAFSYDINNMELCPKCKEHYKGIQYQTCIQCLPEEEKKAAMETVEFGKEWQEMHKKLGID